MSYLSDSICLLNSTYSKDKIQKLFIKILAELHITDFVLISNIGPLCSSNTFNFNNELFLKCGNHSIIFKYNTNNHAPSSSDLECLIAAYIVAIDNSIFYKDITDKVSFGEHSNFPVFSNLISDISDEIEQYKRYGYDFCVAKISLENHSLGEKFEYKLKSHLNTLKDIVRATDSIYRDNKNIYILYRNVGIKDGLKLVDKLKATIKDAEIGIAEWKGSYIIVDLLSEIDNFIYFNQTKQQYDNRLVREDLNKILNKAIMYNSYLIIVNSKEINESHEKFKIFSFVLQDNSYSVLKNYNKSLSSFSFVYEFNYEDIADDIFEYLLGNNKTSN